MKNNLLSEKLIYTGNNSTSTHFHLCSYNKDSINHKEGNSWGEIKDEFKKDRINFIQVHGLKNIDAISEICNEFCISFLIQQDIINVNHPPKIEQYDNYIFIVSKIAKEDGDGNLTFIHACIIHGENFLMTITENDNNYFGDVISAIDKNIFKITQRTSDYLLSVILNSIITGYVSIVNNMNDGLDDLEERLLSLDGNSVNIGEIQTYRRKYQYLKKTIMPFKEHFGKLYFGESTLLHKVNKIFFNDVNDHIQLVVQMIETSHDTISSLIDLYISNNDLKMNNIMKRLTIVSTIFIPLTFLAGIWGMNFNNMPELNWKYGYLMAWGLMIVIGIIIYIFFKRKRWY